MKKPSKVVIYEKPTCSTCREVKRVLTDKGIAFESVCYLKKPLSASELKKLVSSAGMKPGEVLRKNDPLIGNMSPEKN